MHIPGDMGFVAEGPGGLRVLDLADPAAPQTLGTLDTPGTAGAVAGGDGVAYVADLNFGLQVIDVSDPSNPESIGSVWTSGWPRELTLAENTLFLGTEYGNGGLIEILDASTPESPAPIGFVDLEDELATEILLRHDLAHVTCRSFDGTGGSYRIFDVGDPAAPVQVSRFPLTGPGAGLEVQDDHAYLADSVGRMVVLNVADPVNPIFMGQLIISGPSDFSRLGLHGLPVASRRTSSVSAAVRGARPRPRLRLPRHGPAPGGRSGVVLFLRVLPRRL